MKIIDLTLEIYSGMPVYPGDPDVEVEQIQTLEKDGWNMKRLHISLHDGTHVNAPIHVTESGKTLNEYSIEDFIGNAVLYKNPEDIRKDIGVIFHDQNINWDIAKRISAIRPRFIGLSAQYEFELEIEKYLLKAEIISFENLANTIKLPDSFRFYGVPLNIKDADGSPVRAYAVVD